MEGPARRAFRFCGCAPRPTIPEGGICGAGGGTDPGSGRCQTRRDRGRAGVLPHEKHVLLVAAVAHGLFAHLRAQGIAAACQHAALRRLQDVLPELRAPDHVHAFPRDRSEEHTSEPQSLMRTSSAVFSMKKKNCKKKP